MNPLYLDIAGRLGRTALQMAGAALIARGVLTEMDWSSVSGALMAIATTGWTIWSAHQTHNAS